MRTNVKIFDFNSKSHPSEIVGKIMELGWPCEIYRVTLPKSEENQDDEFNAFERCALKLLLTRRYELSALAEEICLPVDLVELILLKLRDRGKIDAHNELMPGVRAAIERCDTQKETAPVEYGTYAVFRECVGGSILPMVLDAKMRSEEVNEDRTVGPGHVDVRSVDLETCETKAPTAVEVLSALRTMARRRRASGASYRIPPAEYVSVASDGEHCWLRVRVVMQRSGDWRILNPFGVGWSPELETIYQDVLGRGASTEIREFNAWQHRNSVWVNDHAGRVGDEKLFLPNEENNRYPELMAVLAKQKDSIVDVYAAIEWALFYALRHSDIKQVIQLLEVNTQEENARWLAAALQSWQLKSERGASQAPGQDMLLDNVDTGDETSSVREKDDRQKKDEGAIRWICTIPAEGELRRFFDGWAKMQTVLCLAILVADRDPASVFNRLSICGPRLFAKIADMKARRDPRRHGKSVWNKIYGDEDMRLMKQVVSTLLPSVRFSDSPAGNVHDSLRSAEVDDDSIRARVAMQDQFGLAAFMRFDSRLQDSLVRSEVFRFYHAHSKGRIDVLEGVNELYASVQSAFRSFLVGGRNGQVMIECAAHRAKDAGIGELPISLRTVRESMLRRTLDGDDQTLQACAVAWLVLSDDDVIHRVVSRMPSFLTEIDRLIVLSGHGNRSIWMSFEEFDSLCKNVFNIIKTLTEA